MAITPSCPALKLPRPPASTTRGALRPPTAERSGLRTLIRVRRDAYETDRGRQRSAPPALRQASSHVPDRPADDLRQVHPSAGLATTRERPPRGQPEEAAADPQQRYLGDDEGVGGAWAAHPAQRDGTTCYRRTATARVLPGSHTDRRCASHQVRSGYAGCGEVRASASHCRLRSAGWPRAGLAGPCRLALGLREQQGIL